MAMQSVDVNEAIQEVYIKEICWELLYRIWKLHAVDTYD